jgi:tRNA uridine 5-carboxymethylaminomethyl modification enzyme
LQKLERLNPIFKNFTLEAKKQILVEAKYKNYIQKQKMQIDKMKNLLNVKIPLMMDFGSISGLSNEVIEKLQRFNPPTLFAASEISGVTPAALDILQIYVKMAQKK